MSYNYLTSSLTLMKAIFLHQSYKVDRAMVCYSDSLKFGGAKSFKKLRLDALEGIEQIITEKRKLNNQQQIKVSLAARNTYRALSWNNCQSIYKHLSHHYIKQRSIIFIADSDFEGTLYRDIAMKNMIKSFESLG